MIDKQKIKTNAISSIVQIIVTGLTLFILYRYLLEIIGPAKLGIWALVLSISSMAQMANLGFSGSIIKYVADYDALGQIDKIISATQTAVISVALLSLAIVIVIYFGANSYFAYTLKPEELIDAYEILPLALLCFWLYMIMSIYHGVLFGFHCITQRNLILSFDSISHLFLCIIFAKKFGLYGLVFARSVQYFITLTISVALLKSRLKGLPVIPYQWSRSIFREMFSYAFKFQVITLMMMFADPLTKGFISRYGNTSMVAYYDMASKLLQLCRSLIVNANQVLIPAFARLKQIEPTKITHIYLLSHSVVFFLAVIGFNLLIVSAPAISIIWLGHYESIFVISIILLSLGWFINTWSVPAYMASMGTGDIHDNLVSHILMSGINIVLIWQMGELWSGMGVVVSWSVALAMGGVSLNYMYCKRKSIAVSELLPSSSRILVLSIVVAMVSSLFIWHKQKNIADMFRYINLDSGYASEMVASVLMIACFIIMILLPAWKNPVRKQLNNIIFKR